MSEAAPAPFPAARAPEAPERPHQGARGLGDIATSTLANAGGR